MNREVNGETALLAASDRLYNDIVRQLLDHPRIHVNKENTMTGRTALIITAKLYRGHHIVRMLLSNPQIDVNVKDSFGTSAFEAAASGANFRTVKLLLQCPKTEASQDDAWLAYAPDEDKLFRDDIAEMIGAIHICKNPLCGKFRCKGSTKLWYFILDPPPSARKSCVYAPIASRDTLLSAGETCCINVREGLLQASAHGELLALKG